MEENNERSFGCAYVTSDFTLEKAERIFDYPCLLAR